MSIHVERYARDRWEAYGDGVAPFTVMAADHDEDEALQRALDRIGEVSRRTPTRRT